MNALVTFQDDEGAERTAALVRTNRNAVVFECYSLDSVLRVSQVLEPCRISVADHQLFAGRVVVRNLISAGPTLLCEATVNDSWVDLPDVSSNGTGDLQRRYKDFFEEHQKLHLVGPEYASAVTKLQSYIWDVRLWLEQVALEKGGNTGNDEAWKRERARKLQEPIVHAIRELFDRFEEQAQQLQPDLVGVHYLYAQRLVRKLLMDAPFVFRTFRKPLGFAGDYEMVDMMFRDPYEGDSLFAKILNVYALSLPPIVAHRNRIEYLTKRLETEVLRASSRGIRSRVLSVGCGPAHEVKNFIQRSALADFATIKLVDFNQQTLDHARRDIDAVVQSSHRKTAVSYERKSVQQMVKEALRKDRVLETEKFDCVYCAGLFDYLPDPVCRTLLNIFVNALRPGGLVIVTNVDAHPSRAQMECFLDWHLVYRGVNEMGKLAAHASAVGEVRVQADLTGVNIFLEIRRSQ
jgi:extracellular factor (EF) 3-hydroxypalmitic acid methyl ester biosynthesis protein